MPFEVVFGVCWLQFASPLGLSQPCPGMFVSWVSGVHVVAC